MRIALHMYRNHDVDNKVVYLVGREKAGVEQLFVAI